MCSSPLRYNIFIMDVVQLLKQKGLGLTYEGRWAGIMMYADAVVLLATSPDDRKL